MPNPVSNAEIEDVLSSIRRLVSDEPQAKRRRSEPIKPVEDRLVLTPAQRVTLPIDARDEANVHWRPDPQDDPDLSGMIVTPGDALEQVATKTNGADEEALSLEDRIAGLEAALGETDDVWEPDGSEDASGDNTRPISADTNFDMDAAWAADFGASEFAKTTEGHRDDTDPEEDVAPDTAMATDQAIGESNDDPLQDEPDLAELVDDGPADLEDHTDTEQYAAEEEAPEATFAAPDEDDPEADNVEEMAFDSEEEAFAALGLSPDGEIDAEIAAEAEEEPWSADPDDALEADDAARVDDTDGALADSPADMPSTDEAEAEAADAPEDASDADGSEGGEAQDASEPEGLAADGDAILDAPKEDPSEDAGETEDVLFTEAEEAPEPPAAEANEPVEFEAVTAEDAPSEAEEAVAPLNEPTPVAGYDATDTAHDVLDVDLSSVDALLSEFQAPPAQKDAEPAEAAEPPAALETITDEAEADNDLTAQVDTPEDEDPVDSLFGADSDDISAGPSEDDEARADEAGEIVEMSESTPDALEQPWEDPKDDEAALGQGAEMAQDTEAEPEYSDEDADADAANETVLSNIAEIIHATEETAATDDGSTPDDEGDALTEEDEGSKAGETVAAVMSILRGESQAFDEDDAAAAPVEMATPPAGAVIGEDLPDLSDADLESGMAPSEADGVDDVDVDTIADAVAAALDREVNDAVFAEFSKLDDEAEDTLEVALNAALEVPVEAAPDTELVAEVEAALEADAADAPAAEQSDHIPEPDPAADADSQPDEAQPESASPDLLNQVDAVLAAMSDPANSTPAEAEVNGTEVASATAAAALGATAATALGATLPTTAPAEPDPAQLREMVGQLVREELQGELGERITRNVRRLVRREIERAFTLRDMGEK